MPNEFRAIINTKPLDNVLEGLRRLKEYLRSPGTGTYGGRFRSLVQQYVSACIAKRFDDQTTPTGGRWKSLADITMYDRERRGFGMAEPKLIRTGRLFRNATNVTIDAVISRKQLVVRPKLSTDKDKEQFATQNSGSGRVPARPFFWLKKAEVGDLNTMLVMTAREALQGAEGFMMRELTRGVKGQTGYLRQEISRQQRRLHRKTRG
jgi:hypothetical protein